MWYMYVLILPLVKAVPLDDECYKSSVESFEGITVDDYGYFHQVVLKCLGKDANVEVSDFMNCVISHNKCNVDWHSLVNWRYCVCDTFLNAVSDCVTKWIIDGHIGDLDCISKLFNDGSKCLLKQKIY
ncbi:hypothetical protein BMR1_03g01382 [Babesia microti strain RI]|uniref:Uncharacterized protein n=1 Tax=Babesia microti (strain RI) TaxID=1133968 RepID=A0A1R4ABE9_BABMR|nr:hypothetical protein BMR1_03g01382 [Babesia microti strain RI]SJK86339.1 hypothetical protein BMR1_03g01382 [Babesia microti strain RI]|eukprot:XP_021338509.1 hypothetical protein BMR1_03g01382 [Babesia microti strain RI]